MVVAVVAPRAVLGNLPPAAVMQTLNRWHQIPSSSRIKSKELYSDHTGQIALAAHQVHGPSSGVSPGETTMSPVRTVLFISSVTRSTMRSTSSRVRARTLMLYFTLGDRYRSCTAVTTWASIPSGRFPRLRISAYKPMGTKESESTDTGSSSSGALPDL